MLHELGKAHIGWAEKSLGASSLPPFPLFCLLLFLSQAGKWLLLGDLQECLGTCHTENEDHTTAAAALQLKEPQLS